MPCAVVVKDLPGVLPHRSQFAGHQRCRNQQAVPVTREGEVMPRRAPRSPAAPSSMTRSVTRSLSPAGQPRPPQAARRPSPSAHRLRRAKDCVRGCRRGPSPMLKRIKTSARRLGSAPAASAAALVPVEVRPARYDSRTALAGRLRVSVAKTMTSVCSTPPELPL